MSYKASLIKLAIKWTPKTLVLWAGNLALTGIARFADFHVDLDARRIYVCTTLHGEVEPIEVWLEDFVVLTDGESHQAILHTARSNKPWLTNLLARITGKAFTIPDVPQLKPHLGLVTELLGPRG